MRSGKSLVELATELEDIRKNAKDYIVPVGALRAEINESNRLNLTFENGGRNAFEPNPHAHTQVAEFSGIPLPYYRRLQEKNPELLARNVNFGFVDADREGAARMVRTVHGSVRGFLSNRYRRLDSYDLLDATLPELMDRGFQPISTELTFERLYVKAVTPRLQAEVKRGDVVQFGIVISNSDVGAGSVRVEPLIFRLVCTNGAIAENAIRKAHLGKVELGDGSWELLTDRTKELTDAAFWSGVRDVVRNSLKPEVFERNVARLRAAAEEPIRSTDLPKVVELAAKATGVTGEATRAGILSYLANGADGAGLNRWGLAQAFAAVADRAEVSYDESTDLQRAAGKVIDLPKASWKSIADAA